MWFWIEYANGTRDVFPVVDTAEWMREFYYTIEWEHAEAFGWSDSDPSPKVTH